MLRSIRLCKSIVVVVVFSVLGACGDAGSSGNDSVAAEQGESVASGSAGAQTVLVADVPNACDVLTRDLAASVLQRSAEEIQAMDRMGTGMDEPCTWYFASNPAVGMEQQLTLTLGAPPLRYVDSQRDDAQKMAFWLKTVASIRDAEVEYLGDVAGGRLYAANLGSRSQLLLATGIRALKSANTDPVGEVLIRANLNEDLAHEDRVNRLKPVVEAAAAAL